MAAERKSGHSVALCLIIICVVLPLGFATRLTCWLVDPFARLISCRPRVCCPYLFRLHLSVSVWWVFNQTTWISTKSWGESAFPIWWLFFKFVCLTTKRFNLLKILGKAANWDSFSRQSRCDSTQCETFNQQTLNHPKCQSCNFVWLKINLMIANCPLSWRFKYLRKKVMLPLTSRKWEISSTARVHFINHDGCSGFCDRWMSPVSPGNYRH